MAGKKHLGDTVTISINIEAETLRRIDALAERLDLSRSRLMRNLLTVSLDEVELMDDFKIFLFMRKLEEAKKYISKSIERVMTTE